MKKIVAVFLICLVCGSSCFGCGTVENQNKESEHSHNYGEWEISTEATCSMEGEKIRYCECGETETKSVPKIEHKWVEATYESPKKCSVCGETIGEKLEKIMPTAKFSNSNYLVVYKANGLASARLDDLQAFVYESSNGKYKMELILKGYMKNISYKLGSEKWAFNYRILISGDDGLLYDSEDILSSTYYEGESVSLYETIYDLPYSSNYEITIL